MRIALLAVVWVFVGWCLGVPAGASGFLGARRCKACHPSEYAHWRTTPHARAFGRLGPGQQRDPRCTTCHATSVEDDLTGVQCESCHGAGRHYWPEYVMKDVELARAVGLENPREEAVCRRCHTPDTPALEPFELEAALRAVQHPSPAPAR